MKKILITGGGGNLATELVKANTKHKITALSKAQLNVCNQDDIELALSSYRPDILIHTAALTRPMVKHIESPSTSINSNIIGTSNITLSCIKYKTKLIYISTDYVYPGITGNYSEEDPLLPINEYAWSKLGGECAVKLYDNSLILRMALCEKPFPHPKALTDIKKSYLYIDEAASIILKLINKKGIINIGGDELSPYEFVKKTNPHIKKITLNEVSDVKMGKNSSMNTNKLNNILND